MISHRACIRRYNSMLKKHQGEVEPNRVNCYKCDRCGHITKTIDIDDGVTPYAFTCDYCGNPFATSTMYNDIAPKQEPTHEWYRPSLKETLKWRCKNASMLEHILNGGLDVRAIKEE